MTKAKLLLARRRLLATLLVLAALVVVSFFNSNRDTVAGVGATAAVVGIAKTPTENNPTNTQIDAAVREAVALVGGLPSTIGPGKKIVIQPNLVEAGWPQGIGITTNAQVVRTVIKMCMEMGAAADNITVCEGSARYAYDTIPPGWSDPTGTNMTKRAFVDCGLDPDADMFVEDTDGTHIARCQDANRAGGLYQSYDCNFQGPYNSSYVTTYIRDTSHNFWVNRKYCIPNIVAQCDVLIRVPLIKSHSLAGVTGALKLAYGMAPSDIYHAYWTNVYKWNLLHQKTSCWGSDELILNAQGMTDMTICRRPDFVVVDGLVGIRNGPCGGGDGGGGAVYYGADDSGVERKMGCIFAGTDPVAVDTIMTLAVGYQVSSIYGLTYAASRSLGTNDPGRIEVRGYHVKDIRRWFPHWASDVRSGISGERVPPTLGGLTLPDGVMVYGQLVIGPTGYSDPVGAGSGLCKGELYGDGALVDSNNSGVVGSAYKTAWDLVGLGEGPHTIKYTLYDKMLNETSLTQSIVLRSGAPVAGALGQPDGTVLSIGPVVFNGKAAAIDNNTFFVSSPDGIRGLRVRFSSSVSALALGQMVAVSGTMRTIGGQRYLDCTAYGPGSMGTVVKPRHLKNQAIGGSGLNAYTFGVYKGNGAYNLGCLVRSSGKVTAGGSDYYYIDDGSLVGDPAGAYKLKVKCGTFAQPAVGSYITVTGFSCTEDDGGIIRRVLVQRTASERLIHKTP